MITQVDVEEWLARQAKRLAQEWFELSGEDMRNNDTGSCEEDYIQDALATHFCLVNVPNAGDAFITPMLDDDADLPDERQEQDIGNQPIE